MEEGRKIIVSDIHGCIDEFKELLDKVNYQHGKDHLISVGDMIDRGSDSCGVVRLIKKLGATVVMGNHEEKFLRWYKHETRKSSYYNNPIETLPHYLEFTHEEYEYMKSFPIYYQFDNFIIVHAALRPNIELKEQNVNEMIRMRYISPEGDYLDFKKSLKMENKIFWTEKWKGPKNVIYGHMVHTFDQPRIDEPVSNVFCYGIDTGCCFGGKLTGMIIENNQISFAQVQAKKEYFKMGFKE